MTHQNSQKITNSLADGGGALLILLKGIWTATNYRACLSLGNTKYFSNLPHLLRREQFFDLDFQFPHGFVGNFDVFASMNALAKLMAIPSRHFKSRRLTLIGNCHGHIIRTMGLPVSGQTEVPLASLLLLVGEE